MRLISCHIENFGKLSDFPYEFTEGLNVIKQENGFGKTTFSTFIKAMFFGLEYSSSRSKDTERKRYYPWNGGKFGGNLTFEIDDKIYRIERFFGVKDKDDTFRLMDLKRNLESHDFTQNIGEEIWKVNRDSYEKTAFIALQDNSLFSDLISKKLGNITEQEKDMEESSSAVSCLEEWANKIKSKRGKGLINDEEKRIDEWKKQVKKWENDSEKITQNEKWIAEERNKLHKINTKIEDIGKEQQALFVQEKKKRYDVLCHECDKIISEIEQIKNFFHGTPYSEMQMAAMDSNYQAYQLHQSIVDKYKLSQEEQRKLESFSAKFKDIVILGEEIKECENCIQEIDFIEQRHPEGVLLTFERQLRLKNFEKKYQLDSHTLSAACSALDCYNEWSAIKKELQEHQAMKAKVKDRQKTKKLFLLLGIMILIVGVILFTKTALVGGFVCAAGVIVFLLSFLFGNQSNVDHNITKIKELEESKNQKEQYYQEFIDSIVTEEEETIQILITAEREIQEYIKLNEYNQHLKEQRKEIQKKKDRINGLLSKYYDFQNSDYSLLDRLKSEIEQFHNLKEKYIHYSESSTKLDENRKCLEELLKLCYDVFPTSVSEAIDIIKDKQSKLSLLEGQLFTKNEDKRKFEVENDMNFEGIVFPEKSSEELISEREEYLSQKEEIKAKIVSYQKDIDELSSDVDKIEDMKAGIDNSSLRIKELEKSWNRLNLAKECLIEAKEELATKYMASMNKNFDKYLKLLNNHDDQFQIDIYLEVGFDEYGQRQKGSSLSKGMKDLVQIGLRFALIEAVYENTSNPILILDDPFVNLDEDKTKKAMVLLFDIARKYQVVYFTCHESRKIENFTG